MRTKLLLPLVVILLLLTNTSWAATYYIDWVGGDDANNGTAKETPWKRAPGMRGCSVGDAGGNCNAKRAAGGDAGDRFILKGGVTWPREALSWDWYFGGGTEESPIYFGVDLTWYTGAAWSRPVLDAEDNVPYASPEGIKKLMRLYHASNGWFVVDNIEFTGLAQLDDVDIGPNMLSVANATEVKNCYFHGWSHGGTATKDYMIVLGTGLISEGPDMNMKIHDNVWDGSDTTQDMAMAYKGSAGHFYNNYVGYIQNGLVTGGVKYIWGNTFDHVPNAANFDATAHMNSVENMGGESIIYNNFFSYASGGVTIWVECQDGDTDYVFNNVSVNDVNQGLQISNHSFSTGNSTSIQVFNNTLHALNAGVSGARISGPVEETYRTTGFFRNNHMIGTTNAISYGNITTPTESNSLGQTNAAALAAGYDPAATVPLYPPAGGATVGAGTAIDCAGIGLADSSPSLALTACGKDTTLGVTYNATTHTVTGNGRTAVARSAWDIGAYEFIGGTATLNGSGAVTLGGSGTITIQ